jgi:hypothetical protein
MCYENDQCTHIRRLTQFFVGYINAYVLGSPTSPLQLSSSRSNGANLLKVAYFLIFVVIHSDYQYAHKLLSFTWSSYLQQCQPAVYQ